MDDRFRGRDPAARPRPERARRDPARRRARRAGDRAPAVAGAADRGHIMSDPSSPDPNSLAERWRRSQEEGAQTREDKMIETKDPGELEVPARCPACRSPDVKTT